MMDCALAELALSRGSEAALQVGAAVAHLRIEGVLHESASAIVYVARDRLASDGPDKVVALKECFPRRQALRLADGSVVARRPADEARLALGQEAFAREALSLQGLRHPALVPVLGALRAHGTVFMAMALINGPTLGRHVSMRGSPDTAGAITAFLDALASGLQVLHDAGVVHGRIGSGKILLVEGRIERPILLCGSDAVASCSCEDDVTMLAQTAWYAATGVMPPTPEQQEVWPVPWAPAQGLQMLARGEGDDASIKVRLIQVLSDALSGGSLAPAMSAASLRVKPDFAPGAADADSTMTPVATHERAENVTGGGVAAPSASVQVTLGRLAAGIWAGVGAVLLTALVWVRPAWQSSRFVVPPEMALPHAVVLLPSPSPTRAVATLAEYSAPALCEGSDTRHLRSCLQTQCRKAANREHAQCVQWRVQGRRAPVQPSDTR
jgi:Protein tyrosine and serine/threonine kinase